MRLVLFTDVNGPATALLMRSLLRLVDRRRDFTIAGVVTGRAEPFRPDLADRARGLAVRTAVAVSNRDVPLHTILEAPLDLERLCRRREIPWLVPEGSDPNDPRFVKRLRDRLRPDVALTIYSQHVFRRRLRRAFGACVNYHDGRLPDFRGVMATSFSILAGAPDSGWAFHHMHARVDAGPVLLQGAVPLAPDARLGEVSRRKRAQAIAALPELLDRIARDDPGVPQVGDGATYTQLDWRAMTRLPEPSNARRAEIERRIRAFGAVQLTIDGSDLPATRLRTARRPGALTFRTGDGQLVLPDRLGQLPRWLYRRRRRSHGQEDA